MASTDTETTDTTGTTDPIPAVVVYQNPYFVSGILQAILKDGLIESIERDAGTTSSATTTENKDRGATLSGKGGLPGVASGDAGATLKNVRDNATSDANTSAQRMRFTYSQTYYFNVLRRVLTEQQLIHPVATLDDAHAIKPGDIVEFSTTFRANEINAVLDIANPELVATITKYAMLRQTDKEMRNMDTHEAIIKQRTLGEQHAGDAAELASAIAGALRKDFRSEYTREFYGLIAAGGDDGNDPVDGTDSDSVEGTSADADSDSAETSSDLTAVTVCETEHFRTQDPDRLLDGQFTVLGKVVSTVGVDVPVLARNKLLDRINPDFLAGMFNQFDRINDDPRAQQLGGYTPTDDDDDDGEGAAADDTDDDPYIVDLRFSATIAGSSFSVLPIAIYA